MDGLALAAVVDITIATNGSIRRPLVAGNANEPARLIEFRSELVELAPEPLRDLEVVPLVAHHVEEGLVAPEDKVLAGRVCTERLVGLAVCVAPEMNPSGLAVDDTQRVGSAQLAACLVPHRDDQIAWLFDAKLLNDSSEGTWVASYRLRQTHDRAARNKRQPPAELVRGVAPGIVGLHREAEALPSANHGRQQRVPGDRRPGNNGDLRALGQRHIVVGRDGIGENPKLELAFAIGLQPDTRRAEPPVPKAHCDGVARPQEIFDHADVERAAPGADIALELPFRLERGTVRGFDCGVTRALGIIELHGTEIGGESETDLD